jgi:hypothetical protein
MDGRARRLPGARRLPARVLEPVVAGLRDGGHDVLDLAGEREAGT